MDYTNTYKSAKSNSGNMALDKGVKGEYNQGRKKTNGATPETLFTSGTNIGEASVDYKPVETKGTYIEQMLLLISCSQSKNPKFIGELDKIIKQSDGEYFDDVIQINFEGNDDLYYSLHKVSIKVEGEKSANGKWKITVSFDDEYDFTELLTRKNGISLGNVANDAATVSQEIGAITPFHVYVAFTMRWKGK